MPIAELVERLKKDPEISPLPYPQKRERLASYFDTTLADEEFFKLDYPEQDRIREKFVRMVTGESWDSVSILLEGDQSATPQKLLLGSDYLTPGDMHGGAPIESDHNTVPLSRLAGKAYHSAAEGIGKTLKGISLGVERGMGDELVDFNPDAVIGLFAPSERAEYGRLVNENPDKDPMQVLKEYNASLRADKVANLRAGAETPAFQMPEEYKEKVGSPAYQFLEDTVSGMASFAPAMALTAVNPAAGTMAMFEQIRGAGYDEMIQKGVDPDRAFIASSLSALAQAPLESAGTLIQIGAIKKMVSGKGAQYLYSLLQAAASEGLEEGLQAFPEMAANVYAANPDLSDGEITKEVLSRLKSKEFWKDTGYQAATGAAGGAMLAGVGAAATLPFRLDEFKSDKQKEIDSAKADQTQQAEASQASPLDEIRAGLKSGSITRQHVNALLTELGTDHPLSKDLESLMSENVTEPSSGTVTLNAEPQTSADVQQEKVQTGYESLTDEELNRRFLNLRQAETNNLLNDKQQKNLGSLRMELENRGINAEPAAPAPRQQPPTKYSGLSREDLTRRVNNLLKAKQADRLSPKQEGVLNELKAELDRRGITPADESAELFDQSAQKKEQQAQARAKQKAIKELVPPGTGKSAQQSAQDMLVEEELLNNRIQRERLPQARKVAEENKDLVTMVGQAVTQSAETSEQAWQRVNLKTVEKELGNPIAEAPPERLQQARLVFRHQRRRDLEVIIERELQFRNAVAELQKAKAADDDSKNGAKTLGGAIRAMGGINPANLKSDLLYTRNDASKAGLFKKKGVEMETAQRALEREGWILPSENLAKILSADPEQLKRGQLNTDAPKTKNQKEQAVKAEASAAPASEMPPDYDKEGAYRRVLAGDLPEGAHIGMVIDGRYDRYTVVSNDVFGDGVVVRGGTQQITLAPADEVEVRSEDLPESASQIDEQANEAATSPENDLPEPTEAQKKAGVYKMGHVKIQGMDITIENPRGSKRSGVSKTGKAWETTMANHYGYFKRSAGKDGDQIDVFIGPDPDSTKVFIVDQVDPETGKFDEHKVIMGVGSEAEARKTYLKNYEPGWNGLGAISETTTDSLKDWITAGRKNHPFGKLPSVSAGDRRPSQLDLMFSRRRVDSRAQAEVPSFRKLTQGGQHGTVTEAAEQLRKAIQRYQDRSMRQGDITEAEQGQVSDPAFELGKRIARIFGKRVTYTYNHRPEIVDFDGVTIGDDQIYINALADKPHLTIVGHELLHELRRDHEDIYAKFLDAVSDQIQDFDQYRARLDDLTKKEGRRLTESKAREELLADFVSEQMTERSFWGAIAERQPTIFKRLAETIKRFLTKVLNKLQTSAGPASKHFKDIKASREAAAEALAEYAKRQNAEMLYKSRKESGFLKSSKGAATVPDFSRKEGDQAKTQQPGSLSPAEWAKQFANKIAQADPQSVESVKKLKASASSDREIHKEANGLFRYVKERFGKGFVDNDMKWYQRAFGLPYWLGKKYESMNRAVEIEIESSEKRSTELFRDFDGDLGKIQETIPKNKKHMQALQDLIWKWDGKRFPKKDVPSDWFKDGKDGSLEIDPQHYEEVRAFLGKEGLPDKVIDAFITIRRKLDEKFIDAEKVLHVEKLEPSLIEEYRSQINKIHNYFPHRRSGNAHVSIINVETGAVIYREHYNSIQDQILPLKSKAKTRAEQWLKESLETGDYPGLDRSGVRIEQGPVKKMPDEAFFQIPMESMQHLVAEAGKRMSEARAGYEAQRLFNKEGRTEKEALETARKRMRADMEKALSAAVAEVFKARGWAAHAIGRKGIPGHETEDIFGILFDYLSGYAGFKTKLARARAHHDNLIKVDPKKHPAEWKHLSKYVKDMLTNQDQVDRAVDTLRGIFFVKYLGFVLKSGLVNLTQNVVMAAPVLSQYTKGGILKAERVLGMAMVDTRRALTSKAAWTGKKIDYVTLSKDEQMALAELVESGASMDLFLRELKGNLPGNGWTKHLKKVVDKSGIFMQIAEKFNRASTGLAAYRIAVKEHGKSHDEAVAFAKQIIYDSHFIYGKINLPTAMRGGDFQKVARAAYTFRSFSHNYISAMSHMLLNAGPEGKKAFARSLRNLVVTGGLTAIPFFEALSQALMWILGDDDEDMLTKIRRGLPNEWLKDLVVYGLPGLAGVDLTGSLQIEIPRSWKEIIGVPYAAIDDTIKSVESLKSGAEFRALYESPFTPIAVRNAMRGIDLHVTGQYSRSGKAINYYGEKGPRKITATEAVLKSLLGLQPVSVSNAYNAYEATERMRETLQRKKTLWANRFVNAMIKLDAAAMEKVKVEIREWNEQAGQEGKPYKKINIQQAVQYRLKSNASMLPKVMRAEARRIAEAWGSGEQPSGKER